MVGINSPVITGISPDTGSSSTDGITNVASVTVSGTGLGGGTAYVYDNGTLVATVAIANTGNGYACTWTAGPITLVAGTNTLTAKVQVGTNYSNLSAAYTAVLNTTPPAAPVITSVTGEGTATAAISGTAAANTTIKVYANGTLVATTTANASGHWSIASLTQTAGYYAYTATATDVAGNVSAASALPTAPVITGISPDSGISATDGITNVATVTLSGTAVPNSTVYIGEYIGGTPEVIGTTTANSTGAWTSGTISLANGANNLVAAAVNAASNLNFTSYTAVLDTTAPAAPTITGISPDTGSSASDGVTSIAAVAVSGTGPANDTINLYDAGTLVSTVIANSSGAWTSGTITLASGSNALTATATDVAGNVSSAGSYTAVYDPGPQIVSLAVVSGVNAAGYAKAGSTIVLEVTVSEATNTTGAPYCVLNNGGTATLSAFLTSTTALLSYTVQPGQDVATLALAANNALNLNGGSCTALVSGAPLILSSANGLALTSNVTIETVAPGAPVITGISPDTGSANADGITSASTVTVSGTGPANATITLYDGATQVGTATANAAGAWTSGSITLAAGSNALTATATDLAGNVSASSSSYAAVLDTTGPQITGLSATGGAYKAGSVLTLALNFNEAVTVSGGTPTLALSNGKTATYASGSGTTTLDFTYTVASGDDTANLTLASSSALALHGATIAASTDGLAATASQANSLAPSGTISINTIAPSAPVISGISPDTGSSATDGITAAATVTVSGTAEANSTVALYDGGTLVSTVTANGAGAWTSGTITLANGANSLTATATDAAGNTSAAGSYSATLEASPPIVAAHYDATTQMLSGTGEAGLAVTVKHGLVTIASTTADGSGAWSVDLSGLASWPADVIATQTDAAGNTGTSPDVVICFMAGTGIATPTGDRPVEDLRIGDPVLRADGSIGRVRWVGRQTISTWLADPLRHLPIRITAGALGYGMPRRDLLVSPDHALFIDGVLAQAGALVNGDSIRREHNVPDVFVYYHVELSEHALLLAEGVAAETFIDNVTRRNFDNWSEHEALYGAALPLSEMHLPRAKACRQLPLALRRRLSERQVAA